MKNLRSVLLSVIMVMAFVGASWGAFPSTLTNAVDGVTEIFASHLNNMEAKVGVDNSAVTTSLDYMLRHSGSIDPGHKHTPPYGGTGNYTYAIGDLLYASSSSALSRLADVAVGQVLISGGVGAAPAWSASPTLTGTLKTAGLNGIGLQIPHLINKAASANLRNSHDAEATSAAVAYTKVKTITLTNGLVGQQRFLFDIKTAGGAATAYGKIYRNGVALGTQQTDVTGGYVTKSEDITQTWNPGDTVELWIYTSDAGQIVSVQNFRIAYDDAPTVAVAGVNS